MTHMAHICVHRWAQTESRRHSALLSLRKPNTRLDIYVSLALSLLHLSHLICVTCLLIKPSLLMKSAYTRYARVKLAPRVRLLPPRRAE